VAEQAEERQEEEIKKDLGCNVTKNVEVERNTE
jgi:hypothetical protein